MLRMYFSIFMCFWMVGCGGGFESLPYAPISSQNEDLPPSTESPSDQKPTRAQLFFNEWTQPEQDPLSTFGMDVDTGSYTFSRSLLSNGGLPDPVAVRSEEFINYFDYGYKGPTEKAFQIHVAAAKSPFRPQHQYIRIGLQGKRLQDEQRKDAHLTLLIDTSGSMAERLELVKDSIRILINNLRESDTLAVATYAGSVQRILAPTSLRDKAKILNAIQSLQSGGGTAMGSGMKLAYEMASQSYKEGQINRVIVFSDGDANIGETRGDKILETIEEYVKKGITMSTIGFGVGNYRDDQMEQLANKGNGNYYYIDTARQAQRVFQKDLLGTLQVIAKDAKIQIEFNPRWIKKYRLVGYENRQIPDQDFRNNQVDAGEVGAGHAVTALYEVEMYTSRQEISASEPTVPSSDLLTVRLRYKSPEQEKEVTEVELGLPSVEVKAFESAPSSLQWAVCAGTFAEFMQKSPHIKGFTFEQLFRLTRQAASIDHPDQKEMIELMEKAQNLLSR